MRRSTWRSRVFFGMNSPRICFLKALRKVLEDMPDRIEMVEWGLGDRPDLSPGGGSGGVATKLDWWTTETLEDFRVW